MKLTLLAALGLGGIMASNHAIADMYDYVGCVNLSDLSCLTAVPVNPAGVLTPESCQAACAAYEYAVVFYE